MYDRKYRITSIEQFNRYNPIYRDIEGSLCYPAYLKVGERGWLLYERKDWIDPVHRVHTSEVKSVEFIGKQIILTTQNTRFTLVEETSDEN